MGTDQLDNAILDLSLRESACIGGDVAQITYVSNLVTGSAVGLAMGVEVWASRSATVGVVTELMNVHSALSVGVGVLDFVLDDCGGILIRLRELDGTGNTGITTKDSNSFGHFFGGEKASLVNWMCLAMVVRWFERITVERSRERKG